MNFKNIIEDSSTKAGRSFDYIIQILIVISIISFSIETLPNLSKNTVHLLSQIETVVIWVFTLEYLARICLASKKREYIFSFYGLIDLVAIAPFYILTSVDLRSLRIFRLFRLLRLFKLVRYNNAVLRLSRAFISIKEEFVIFSVITIMLLYLSSVGIYYFESEAQPDKFKSIFHSFWWSLATLTTVGYGDAYPITVGGRIFTFFILMIGLGIVAVPAGLLSSALSKTKQDVQEEK